MYQPIPSFTGVVMVVTIIYLLLCFGFAFIKVGIQQKSKKYIISGVISIALIVSVLPLANWASEQEDAKRTIMENNILKKYEFLTEYDGSRIHYLKNVDYKGPNKGGVYSYFDLTYVDDSIEGVNFFFDDKTGEPKPRCLCDLKKIESLK